MSQDNFNEPQVAPGAGEESPDSELLGLADTMIELSRKERERLSQLQDALEETGETLPPQL
jgi:hypothetical protein